MVDGRSLVDKLGPSSSVLALLCLHCEYPLVDPRQVSCGDRVCADCYGRLSGRKFVCKKCHEEVTVDEDCFRDKAVEYELNRTLFPCLHSACPWTGTAVKYRDHVLKCKFSAVGCPNEGCDFKATELELVNHLGVCPAQPVKCKRCQETIPLNREHEHLSMHCSGTAMRYPANYGGSLLPRNGFASNGFGKMMVEPDSAKSREDSDDVEKDSTPRTRGFREKKLAADHQLSIVWSKVDALERALNRQLEPLKTELAKFEGSLNDLQESFTELSLMVQTLQATSYNGEFVWKIPEVMRRVKEARSGITYSLYSAPFYTSRFGYKMCLRLYLNGDGSGKGTHLSFFLTIMKGEYDALLSWPFQHLVTLMLLDQDKRKNIVQAFRPEPSSSSFWQPKTEMNIASGCPRFAPLSVLSNPGYVRNDTIYFKAVIEGSGFDF